MATNALEAQWDAQLFAPDRPYMETNRWLDQVMPAETARRRRSPECKEITFFGQTIRWTMDGGRPFPPAVFTALERLIEFAELGPDWDSYGGQSLRQAAVKGTLELIFAGHQRGMVPRLHPLSDGGVGLNWEVGDRELEAQVAGTGLAEAFYCDEQGEEEVAAGSPASDVVPLIGKLFEVR